MGSDARSETNEYNKDKVQPGPKLPEGSGGGGYPNPKVNTQTKHMYGTGAATKGCYYSKNSD